MATPGKTKKHYIHFYYGLGKGKTTAALGLVLRAVGQGRKAVIVQWLKGRSTIGEMKASKLISSNFIIKQFGPKYFTWDQPGPSEHKRLAEEGFRYLEGLVEKGDYDVLVLDEIGDAVVMKFIPEKETINLIKRAAQHGEVIVTGHKPIAGFVDMADLVTEMRKVKHYFDQGQMAREGIEY